MRALGDHHVCRIDGRRCLCLSALLAGLLLCWAYVAFSHRAWNDAAALAVIGIGNAAFYVWISLQILRAEILARGHLSRHFLR